MLSDPMTSEEQYVAEQTERAREAQREDDWRDAERAARIELGRFTCAEYPEQGITMAVWAAAGSVEKDDWSESQLALRAFTADHGMPDLLRVIARALEPQK